MKNNEKNDSPIFDVKEMSVKVNPMDQHNVTQKDIEEVRDYQKKGVGASDVDFSVEELKGWIQKVKSHTSNFSKDSRNIKIPAFVLNSYTFLGLKDLVSGNIQDIVTAVLVKYLEERKSLISKEIEKATKDHKKSDYFS